MAYFIFVTNADNSKRISHFFSGTFEMAKAKAKKLAAANKIMHPYSVDISEVNNENKEISRTKK
jgi:hypothetical protein